jgi:hypothetical protein
MRGKQIMVIDGEPDHHRFLEIRIRYTYVAYFLMSVSNYYSFIANRRSYIAAKAL